VGNARYDDHAWNAYSTATTKGRTREQIFTSRDIDKDLDPTQFKLRECVDSPANPETTPIILGADETGSMGVLAETIIRGSLGEIMKALYDSKPVSDPQIACAGIGDAYCDRAPLQVTQFEAAADVLGEQVKKIYLEGGGGGNNGESYPLLWVFADQKTSCDAFRKRGKKGYIFTIGDEQPHTSPLTGAQLRHFVGLDAEQDLGAEDALRAAEKRWHVFHLIVKPVGSQPVLKTWRSLLGERAIEVEDIERLAAGIVTTIQVVEGVRPITGFTGKDALIARSVVKQLTASI
jgi:hypothetical protein